MSKWLTWEASQPQIKANPPGIEPAKPPKPSFAGFEGAFCGENPIIRDTEPTPAPERNEQVKHPAQGDNNLAACPYALPEGVRLLRYERKAPPVHITVFSEVIDIPKFIKHSLAELDARLHNPVQIKAGDSVFELLSKLADCGVELRLEWPPERIIENPPEREPSKPAKPPATPELNAHGVEIGPDGIPF
jgi:hypothetical protein